MKKNVALLLIDAQNDFVLPNGALPVAGAEADMNRWVTFAKNNMNRVHQIFCTLDSHNTLHVAHPSWFANPDGTNVLPFTQITSQDVKNGKYTINFAPQKTIIYLEQLEAQGEFTHMIWPYHCVIGTTGAALYQPVSDFLSEFERKMGMTTQYVAKGSNPLCEHFGAFRANVPVLGAKETELNQPLLNALNQHDIVVLAGEARSHCVANSLKQLLDDAAYLSKKLYILEDCMSDVPGLPQVFYDEVQKIYDRARNEGVTFIKSTDIL